MSKEINMLVFVVILLSLVGCSGGGKTTDLNKDIYKGTEGVLTSFYGNIPLEVFEGETLSLAVKFDNKGAYEVKNAKFVVSLEKEYMGFSNGGYIYETLFSNVLSQKGKILEGKNSYTDYDDFHVEEIPIKVGQLDDFSEYHDTTILTSFCYDYYGIAVADVCIDTDPHNIKLNDKVCNEISSISLSSGQGGPLIIDRIETRMLVDNSVIKPQFKIFFRNVGSGTVITPGKYAQVCSSAPLGYDSYNTMKLTQLEFSSYNLNDFECLPQDLMLIRNEDFMTCTFRGNSIGRNIPTYLTPLKVEFAYGYKDTASKELKIKKIQRY
jgi:hypothetical protein